MDPWFNESAVKYSDLRNYLESNSTVDRDERSNSWKMEMQYVWKKIQILDSALVVGKSWMRWIQISLGFLILLGNLTLQHNKSLIKNVKYNYRNREGIAVGETSSSG